MGSETSSETKAMVTALHGQRLSYKKISEQLLNLGTSIHYKTIGKLIRREGTNGIGWAKPAKKLPPQNLPSARTKDAIKKVKTAILKKRPDSQRKLGSRLGCSKGTVGNIIKLDLGLDARKKKKLHHLTDVQKKQRYERGKLFISYLWGNRVKKIFTMDETWITLDDCNSEGDYFYTDGFLEVPDDWRKKLVKQWPKKIMVAIGICWNGMSKPYVVDGNAKVTAQYFIDNVLSPMVNNGIPRLYPKNSKNITVHFDSAKSHVAILTQNWMEENHPNYIPQDHWMANSPDLAPLDYAINGILKKILGERKVTTITGLSKVLQEVCANFDLGVIQSKLAWAGCNIPYLNVTIVLLIPSFCGATSYPSPQFTFQ